MAVAVVAVDLGAEGRTWTVLGPDHLPLVPVEQFLEHLRLDDAPPATVRSYAQALRQYFAFLDLTSTGWADVTAELFGGFRRWLATGLLPGAVPIQQLEPLRASSTVANRSAAVLSFYRYQHDLHDVPAAGRLYRLAVGGRERGRYREQLVHLRGARGPSLRPIYRNRAVRPRETPLLTPDQVTALLDGCARPGTGGRWSGSVRDRLLFETLAETGMRLGECLALQHRDWVIGAGASPYVEVVPRGDHPHGYRVKGGRPRRIYVSDRLQSLYGEYLWQLCDAGAADGDRELDSWWVFVNLARGTRFAPLRAETVYDKVGGLKRRLPGVLPARFTPHWLRHTHASALLLAGVAPHVVMRRLGHADIQTTLSTYGWVSEDAELRLLANWNEQTAGWRGIDV